MKTLKKLTALLGSLALFMGMSADALAISRIPQAMQQTNQIIEERSVEFQGSKNTTESSSETEMESMELQRQYWEELFAFEQKADEEKGQFLMELDVDIKAEDFEAVIDLQLKAIVDVVKQKLEEKLSGSVYFNDKSPYLDEPEDGKIQGNVTIRVIEDDFYLLLENFITEGSAEEEMMIFDLLCGNWVHFDATEALGENFWSQSGDINASDLNAGSVKDIEQVFAEVLMQEADLSEIEAYKVASQFSLQKLFYISKYKSSDGQLVYNLELRKDRVKRAFLSTGQIIDEPLDEEDIAELEEFLDKIELQLSFYANEEKNTFEAMRIVFSMEDIEDIDSVYVKFSIDVLDWDEDTKIRAPESYEDLEDFFMMLEPEYEEYEEVEVLDSPEAVIE